jgi:iron complex outermembrane receptor protein
MRPIPLRTLLATLCLAACAALPLHAQTGTVTGTLKDAVSGTPVAGARVEAVGRDGRVLASTTTDAQGSYTLPALPAGSYTLVVTGRNFEARRLAARVRDGGTTTASAEIAVGAMNLDPLVVSASKREEKALSAPAHVEVVGTEAIDARPAISAVEHLRSVPGIDVASTGVQSSNVVARGFNNIFSGSLHMLSDYRIAGVPSLRVNLVHFIPTTNEDVERMEVVLGPGAALYGPNTADGILHLITRSPLDEQGTTITASGGEQSVFHGTFRTSHLFGENFGIKLSGQYLSAQEWHYTDPGETAEQAKFASNLAFYRADLMRATGVDQTEADRRIARIGQRDDDVRRWSGEVRADWRVRPDLTAVFSAGTSMQGSGVELTGLGAAQARDWRYTYYQARASWGRLFGQAYLNTSDAGETYLLRTGAPIVDRSTQLVGQLQHGLSLGDGRQRFTYGGDYILTTPRTAGTINGAYEDHDETRELGAYLQSETRLSSMFELVMAGRVDKHSALPDPVFSPRAALVFTPAENQAFRVSYNRAFSTPSSLNQFLDLGTSIPDATLAQLGYSLRVQGTGENGFSFRDGPGGTYQMRSPFTPQALGGPGALLPADATLFWRAAVQAMAAGAAAKGQALDPQLVAYLSGLAPGSAQIGTNYFDVNTREVAPLSQLTLDEVAPIRESTSTTWEAGYKGILGGRFLLAADVYRTTREQFVTPLQIQTPLLTLNGPQVAAYLVPKLMGDLGMSQAQATAVATQLATGIAQVPVGTVSSAGVDANGAQLLVTYQNVDEQIHTWGTDLSATALLTDALSLGVSASYVDKDRFQTESAGLVTLNAPRRKASVTLGYRSPSFPLSGEFRVRYTDQFPVRSGVFVGTRCIGETGPLVEDCVDSFTLADLSLGYRLPRLSGTSVQLSVTNLFDDRYRAFPGSPFIGRMALLRLKYQF